MAPLMRNNLASSLIAQSCLVWSSPAASYSSPYSSRPIGPYVRPRPRWAAKFTRSQSGGVSQRPLRPPSTTAGILLMSSVSFIVHSPLHRCQLDALVTQICIAQFCTELSWRVRTCERTGVAVVSMVCLRLVASGL